VAEVRLLLKTQGETIERLQSEAARAVRAEEKKTEKNDHPSGDGAEAAERAAELQTLQSQLIIERQRTETLRLAAEKAEVFDYYFFVFFFLTDLSSRRSCESRALCWQCGKKVRRISGSSTKCGRARLS
jgi:hypothetical protein